MAKGKAGDLKIKLGLDDKELEKDLKGLKDKASSAVTGIGKVAGATAKGVAAVGAAISAAGVAVMKVGGDFETAFAQVQTIMNPTEKSMEDMKNEILDLSAATGIAATDLSASVYNAISATGDTANAVKLVESATQLATAGFTDTESALGVITTAMNSYKLSAEEATMISDSLVQTQNLGVTTIAELSSSMGKAIASASAYGIDLYNVEAAYIAMTKSGISTAESTTYMSSMFKELGDSGSEIAKVLKKQTGQSFDQLLASGKSLSDVLKIVYEAAGEDSTALMNMWGSAEAGKAANAIINQGFDQFASSLDQLQNSSGTTASAYETMTNTVQHQTEMLTNSVKNLGIALFENFQPEISDMIGQANGWMSQLGDAFATGGIDGMGDAVAEIVPQMLDVLTNTLSKGIAGVAQKLPNLIKNLMSAIPSILRSLNMLVPQIASALFSGFGEAVGSLISMLPELVPMLAEGLGNLVVSAFNGILTVFDKAGDGIADMFKQLGILSYDAGENLDRVMKSIDKSAAMDTVNEIEAEFKVNTNITTEDPVEYQNKINGAVEQIRTAIATAVSDPITAQEIADAIIDGNTSVVLADTLKQMGIDPEAATAAAEAITNAQEVINSAITGLGLSDKAQSKLEELVADGATKEEITAYLTNQGVDAGVADAAAQSITDENAKINAAVDTLGLDAGTEATLRGNLTSDKDTIAACLELLNLSDADIEGVLASYSTVKGSLTAGLLGIFSDIGTILTDGKPDSPEDISGLEDQVRGWADEAYGKLEEWYNDEIETLQKSGKTGAELEASIAEVDTQYNTLREGIKTAQDDSIAYIESMAGKSTQYVQAHLGELQVIADEAASIAAQIDTLKLNAEQVKDYSASRDLVARGRTQDSKTQLEAIKLTAQEYESAVDEANAIYSDAVEKAREAFDNGKISETEYQEQEAAAAEELANAYKEAGQNYNDWMRKIIQGISVANPEFAAALADLQNEQVIADLGTNLHDAIADSINNAIQGEPIDLDSFWSNLNISDDQMSVLADRLGYESAEDLQKAVENSLKGMQFDGGLMDAITGYSDSMKDAFAALFSPDNLDAGGIGTETAALFAAAIEAGWIKSANGIDWTSGDAITNAIASLGDALSTGVGDTPISLRNVPVKPASIEVDTSDATITTPEDTQPADVDVPVNGTPDIENKETIGAEAQHEAANAITDAETGEPVKLVQNAVVDLQVSANITGTDFVAAGQAAADDFAIGVATGGADTVNNANALANSALNALTGAVSKAQSLGSDFAKGYALGISNGTNAAVNAAINMAKNALKGVQQAQDSASPAKETMKLGNYFGEGYEIGIRESMQRAVDTAKVMAGEILNASVIGSNGLGVLRVEAGSEPLQVESATPPTPIVLNSKTIGEVQAGINSSEIAISNKKYRRGVGG